MKNGHCLNASVAEYYLFGKTVEICPYLTINQKQNIHSQIGYWKGRGCAIQKEQLPEIRANFKVTKEILERRLGSARGVSLEANSKFLDLGEACLHRADDLFQDISRIIEELEKFIQKHGSLKPLNGMLSAAFEFAANRKGITSLDTFKEALDQPVSVEEAVSKDP